jgi:hypothetical protein
MNAPNNAEGVGFEVPDWVGVWIYSVALALMIFIPLYTASGWIISEWKDACRLDAHRLRRARKRN